MRVRVEIDRRAVAGHVQRLRRAAILGASEQALADCNAYVPLDSGALRGSSLTHSDAAGGRLVWSTPYARYQFAGEVYGPNYPIFDGGGAPAGFYSPRVKRPTGRRLRYRRSKNPNASARWTEVARRRHAGDWRRAAERAMRGR